MTGHRPLFFLDCATLFTVKLLIEHITAENSSELIKGRDHIASSKALKVTSDIFCEYEVGEDINSVARGYLEVKLQQDLTKFEDASIKLVWAVVKYYLFKILKREAGIARSAAPAKMKKLERAVKTLQENYRDHPTSDRLWIIMANKFELNSLSIQAAEKALSHFSETLYENSEKAGCLLVMHLRQWEAQAMIPAICPTTRPLLTHPLDIVQEFSTFYSEL
ncbi:hypothetical protein NDU88_004638 [Pleurodeles waltl]|uniref:Uncharacterized protein n=1 Tax=Pleurodeles waltl TaxID=8319 RepID=A0AAV7NK58_PLEWA|nr:hypothetical protein NDU88_004638 [Pleurodeles waltl]